MREKSENEHQFMSVVPEHANSPGRGVRKSGREQGATLLLANTCWHGCGLGRAGQGEAGQGGRVGGGH